MQLSTLVCLSCVQGSSGEASQQLGAAAGAGKMVNGATVSSTTVCVPTRIHSVTTEYLKLINFLYQSHDYWEQATSAIDEPGTVRPAAHRPAARPARTHVVHYRPNSRCESPVSSTTAPTFAASLRCRFKTIFVLRLATSDVRDT